MAWLQQLDEAGFRFINQGLTCGPLDWLMPVLSGNPVFGPVLALLGIWLVWKGGARGRVCLLMLLLLTGAVNNALVDWLKELFARPRPFLTLPDARVLLGRGDSGSLPSGHTANWFSATFVVAWYYRRVFWGLLPLAAAVGLSRIYNGVHYPGDVLAGALLGALVGGGGVWLVDALWRTGVRAWFPIWWRHLPSLSRPVWHPDALSPRPGEKPLKNVEAWRERQWLRLGYGLTLGLLLFRWWYIASGTIQLSEDEAYQWVWSKHLALSYFSKPPLIAYFQFLGTTLWGDSEFGIRFFSPLITAVISVLMLRFFAREVNARAGFFLVLTLTTAPLISVGSVLMTIDPPLVLFWTAAMLAGWKAVQPHGRTRDWIWVGLWSGLGFLSKYAAVLQWVSFFLFLALWRPARRHLRRPGPYLGLVISALAIIPVWIWNAQHDWITLTHLHDRAGLNQEWEFTLRYLGDFTGAVVGLLNPVFAVGLVWAGIQAFRKRRHDARLMYLLAMGAPLMIGYWLYALRARVHPNWIAPAVLPLFAVMVIYADARWREAGRTLRRWLVFGLILGGMLVGFLHETDWVEDLAGRPLPAKLDPLRRVRYWSELAEAVERARQEVATRDGRPAFIIAAHYGLTGQISFYLPEGRARVKDDPIVFYQSADHPENQFWFWPGYRDRHGQSAVYVIETDEERPAPPRIVAEFESVTSLGLHDTVDRGRVMRRVQLFACHNLR